MWGEKPICANDYILKKHMKNLFIEKIQSIVKINVNESERKETRKKASRNFKDVCPFEIHSLFVFVFCCVGHFCGSVVLFPNTRSLISSNDML